MDKPEKLWRKLCAQAAVEQDPEKLMQLVTEITRLLAEEREDAKSKGEPPRTSPEEPCGK